MRINLKHIPREVQIKYNLDSIEHNGFVLMEIRKGIYDLQQAVKLAQDRLIAHLAKNGYLQCINTPCLFVHVNNGVAFTLVVDDFLIKYSSKAAANHLLNTLRRNNRELCPNAKILVWVDILYTNDILITF